MLNRFTGSEVLAEDKLFATLDPTTRRVELPNGAILLLTDTVGFIRNLPHRLVDAFKATLEEAILADFLVHVLDASHPEVETFRATTLDVLKELKADEKKTLTVFNKIDLVDSPQVLHHLRGKFPDAVFVSLHTGQGCDELMSRMADLMADKMVQMKLALPQSRADLLSVLHASGKVRDTRWEYEEVLVTAMVPARLRKQFAGFEQEQNRD